MHRDASHLVSRPLVFSLACLSAIVLYACCVVVFIYYIYSLAHAAAAPPFIVLRAFVPRVPVRGMVAVALVGRGVVAVGDVIHAADLAHAWDAHRLHLPLSTFERLPRDVVLFRVLDRVQVRWLDNLLLFGQHVVPLFLLLCFK